MIKFLISTLQVFCLSCSAGVLAEDTPIIVSGTLLNSESHPLSEATLVLGGQATTTDRIGGFVLSVPQRKNSFLEISHPDFKTEIIPLHLLKNGQVEHYFLDPVIMSEQQPLQTRFVFGGDTSFGRRYIDPDEVTPRDQVPVDNNDALILISDPEPGSRNVVQYIRPIFQNADWSVLNLETPVTENPTTPHLEKAFAFFTLPESLPALTWLGIDYVSLGNNHLYDYLDLGIQDTLTVLNDLSIPHSGAGLNSDKAFLPYHQLLDDTVYSFLAMNAVSGSQHLVDYVVSETKGGAADSRDKDSVETAIKLELDRHNFPIVQIHGGKEYTFEPTENFFNTIKFAVEAGAKLVICHHPHVAQGIGLIDGVVTIHSLGNLIFDQARLETMLGLVARIDMDVDNVTDIRFYPIYIDNFVPKPLTGDLANIFLRRIGEFSHAYGGLVYPYNNQGWVAFNDDQTVRIDRALTIDITIPASGAAVVDLRQLADSRESLLSVLSENNALDVQIGRDVLNHGDFEDWDIDNAGLVASRWDTSKSSSEICSFSPFRGRAALCSTRSSDNTSESVIPFRNRTRVIGESTGEPNKDLSLFGYFQGLNAGSIKIITRFFASVGEVEFGEEETITHPGGTFNWQAMYADINMPEDSTDDITDVENNPRAVRFFIRQSPPVEGEGIASFDDFAVINWEEHLTLNAESTLAIPHARDFLRIKGLPGSYQLTLKFSHYQPKNSHFVAPLLEANGEANLVIDDNSNVQVTLNLQQHLHQNPAVDWWVYATTDSGQLFSYVYPQGWQVGEHRTIANPQLNIADFDLFNGVLPQGSYTVNFCIDENQDNIMDCTWRNSLQIDVNSATN